MAGALSGNAPRPVSVVTVDGGVVENVPSQSVLETDEDPQVEPTAENPRSFTSTEAQTEVAPQIVPLPVQEAEDIRDVRRRERRMRRQHRRALRTCSMPPTYPGAPGCMGSTTAPGVPLVPPVGGFLHPPPPHLGLRGLSLGLPFPVPTSVSAFGRSVLLSVICRLVYFIRAVQVNSMYGYGFLLLKVHSLVRTEV